MMWKDWYWKKSEFMITLPFLQKNHTGFLCPGFRIFLVGLLCLGLLNVPGLVLAGAPEMTEDRAFALAEEFGVDVGEVDEEIRKILGLLKAEGVVVFAVIGNTAADLAGIKSKSIIKEVDGMEIHTILDLGKALEKALPTQNFSVATYEPADIDDQGIGGGLNFHLVRIQKE
ncbi:PDZ domain-containing protein [Candidatus Nitronereus thalassa]|uniref:PDZ domain-containing protein n=1 Tax=Candidatus Nitronereus thalassa TaxID=3020898 RepID=A0ABU3KD12_9BACT|nr:PDZ domain-containing protein [Candidatus Nitronereus thalassa]MDT7044147.1 PDZ domain-containing protein [Candidatus Nitronereus thalassa]